MSAVLPQRAFFERSLGCWIRLHVVRPGAAKSSLGPPPFVPTAGDMDGMPQLLRHPRRDFTTGPQPSIWRWFAEDAVEVGALVGRE